MLKQFVSILLATFMLSIGCKDFMLVLSFKINQDFIAEVFCINQDVPEMECNGKCYLAKKADETQKREEKAPIQRESPNFAYLASTLLTIRPTNTFINLLSHYKGYNSYYCPQEILQPPEILS